MKPTSGFWRAESSKLLFFATLVFYLIIYAPWGINESDGGFLSGLAWQILNGKTLYQDVIYVRPPLPIWLRALEIKLLPEHYAVLGERWLFYLKVAFYAWLAAAILAEGSKRWWLACFGFVLSVHCYPAAAWHTVDGILFAVFAVWCVTANKTRTCAFMGGLCLCLSLLCKQSFYPLPLVFGLWFLWARDFRWFSFFTGFILFNVLFITYLHQNDLWANYKLYTTGAASGESALQHAFWDYLHIHPALLLPSLFLVGAVWFPPYHLGKYVSLRVLACWLLVMLLMASYTYQVYVGQTFTIPYAQTRILFWLAAGLAIKTLFNRDARPLLLLSITWCAAISWGYNLPILFSTPLVWGIMELWPDFPDHAQTLVLHALTKYKKSIIYTLLLGVFFYAGQFVYRDAARRDMQVHLGEVFPALRGIYSTQKKADLYRDLKQLCAFYGPNVKTLPTFTQANFLTHTYPSLPLDWVVAREMGRDTVKMLQQYRQNKPYLLIEKVYLQRIMSNDPEYEFCRKIMKNATKVAETKFFIVLAS